MKSLYKYRFLIVILLFVIFILSFYMIRDYMASRNKFVPSYLKGDQYNMVTKKYGVNEYSVTNVSDEDMARIYLNKYINNIRYNMEEAYNSLNSEYRNAKFGSFSAYENSINFSQLYNIELSRYYVQNSKEYVIFGVYDNYNNLYIFKTNGVMQYEVYLDDYTVEI